MDKYEKITSLLKYSKSSKSIKYKKKNNINILSNYIDFLLINMKNKYSNQNKNIKIINKDNIKQKKINQLFLLTMIIITLFILIKTNDNIINLIKLILDYILSAFKVNINFSYLELIFFFFTLYFFSKKLYQREIRIIKKEYSSNFLIIIIIILLLFNIKSSEIIKSYSPLIILKIKSGNNSKNNPKLFWQAFNSEKVEDFSTMFSGCASLIPSVLGDIITNTGYNFKYIFENCYLLTSLDLSSFSTPDIVFFDTKFNDFISLNNFNYDNKYFSVFILNNQNLNNEIKNTKCYTIVCEDNWKERKNKIIESFDSMNNDNFYFTSFKNKYDNKHYLINKGGTYKIYICFKFKEGYYPINDYENCFTSLFNCSQNLEDYYLDNINHKNCENCLCTTSEICPQFHEKLIEKNKEYVYYCIECECEVEKFSSYRTKISKNLRNVEGLINNVGSYIMLIINIIHYLIMLLFFYKNYYKEIQNKIIEIKIGLIHWTFSKNADKKIEDSSSNKKRIKKTSKLMIEKNINNLRVKKRKNKDAHNAQNKVINHRNNEINKIRKIKKFKTKNKKGIDSNKRAELIKTKSKIIIAKKIMEYNDEEINNLSYEKAITSDKRTYTQYYISLIKTKHLLISSFFNNTDYNIKALKIDLIFFDFALEYTVSALFFIDETMHKTYEGEDEGEINQFSLTIYSLLISIIISALAEKFALTEDAILDYKSLEKKEDLKKEELSLLENIKTQLVIYFIFSGLFLLFFWYYVAMFCAVYHNTQLNLFKDTLMDFVFYYLIYPFLVSLLPGMFRIPSLTNRERNRSYLYEFSQYLQIL